MLNKKCGWSPESAYAIGLITSDGCLSKDGRHIKFASKDFELIEKFKVALNIEQKVSEYRSGSNRNKKYYVVDFSNKALYQFLLSIGLTPAKSKTIQSVSVPEILFADFLRGLFDGDGTIYSTWDRRWKNSFVFQISFASASFNFLSWIKDSLHTFYTVNGFIRPGDGVYNLRYVKGDSKILLNKMYYRRDLLFLSRKYEKAQRILEQEKEVGIPLLQKHRRAAVAQW